MNAVKTSGKSFYLYSVYLGLNFMAVTHRNIFFSLRSHLEKTKAKLTLPTSRLLNQAEDLDAELQIALERMSILVR